jgi:polyisoprenyl-teichoic acid--peptidoglycan teichoic acid transferase
MMIMKNIEPKSSEEPIVQSKLPQPRKPTKKIWLALTAIGIVSLIGGGAIASLFSTTPFLKRKLSEVEAAVFRQDLSFAKNNLQVPVISKPVNILLLGIKTNLSDIKNNDGRERKKIGYDAEVNSLDGLSDTMMLLRFDPQSKKVVVFGIPRDTKVQVNGKSEKINAIDHESGVAEAAKVVSNTLNGVQIDRYVRLNNFGLEKLIDSLDGVTVSIPKDIKYQDDSQHFYVNLKAGKQHLDGKTLLNFLRFRHDPNGDIGRIQRQQMVIRSMLEQWVKPTTIAKIPQLMSIVKDHVDTNLTVEETIAIGGFMLDRHKDKNQIQMLMMPGSYNGDGKHSVSYWLPNPVGIKNMMAKYFNLGLVEDTLTNVENIHIKIQDTSYYPDATNRLITKLKKAGYRNVHLDRDPKVFKENLDTTQVIAQQGELAASRKVANTIGMGKVEISTGGDLYSEVTIKVGKDLGKLQQQKYQ